MSTSSLRNSAAFTRRLTLVGCLLALGCGGGVDDPFERTEVTGTVSLDGAPLPFGEINFKGPPNDKDEAAQAFLPIRDGKFTTEGNSSQPAPGDNEVVITVYASDPVAADAQGESPTITGQWTGKTVIGQDPLAFSFTKKELEKP